MSEDEAAKVARKIVSFIHLGMNDEAVELIVDHANDLQLFREVKDCSRDVLTWVSWAAPPRSLLRRYLGGVFLSVGVSNSVSRLRHKWMDRLKYNDRGL